jgi:uncharacterized protein DUF4126
MALPIQSLAAIAIGIGLAAATGFRVFLPLLIAGLAARWGGLSLAHGFQWLSSNGVLLALGTASIVEVAAYYIPLVDHVLDVIGGPAAVLAGVLASASAMVDVPPSIMWPVAIIGGGGIAGLTKTISALARAKSGWVTAGLANPIVSTGETCGAIVTAIAAIVVPLICLLAIVVLLVWISRRLRAVRGNVAFRRTR